MEAEESETVDNSPDNERNDNNIGMRMKFRNYTPQTQLLDGLYYEEKAEPGSIKHFIQDKLDLLKVDEEHANSDDPARKYGIDPEMLDPQKPDWDLKRNFSKKSRKLDKLVAKSCQEFRKKQAKKKSQKSK